MGLESGTYISDFVSSNPAGTDLESQGDDHIRLIKAVLQSTFPSTARAFRFFDTKTSQTSTYSVSESNDMHKLIPFDCTSGALTAGLPATAIDGWWCLIRKTDSSANAVTIDPSGAGTINGASTITLTVQYEAALVWWDNQASTWAFFRIFPTKPYYSGAQDIPFSDIAPSANAKRILGAATATDFSEQTIATVLEWLGTAARGDLILRGASAFAYKNLGASGTFLASDGTDLIYRALAAQSDMETGTNLILPVSPGVQKYHPAHPKVQGRFNSSGTLLGSNGVDYFGITSVVRNSAGSYTVTLSTAMAGTNYGVIATPQSGAAIAIMGITITSSTVFTINSLTTTASGTDASIQFAVFGDLP